MNFSNLLDRIREKILTGIPDNVGTNLTEILRWYLHIIGKVLILIVLVATLFFFVSSWSAGWRSEWLKIPWNFDQQALSNYFSASLSTVVALAGSIVAIVLATNSQISSNNLQELQKASSNKANELQEQANDLQKLANELNDPVTQRAHQIIVARNRLLAANQLLMSSSVMTESESAQSGAATYGYFHSTAMQLQPVFTNSLLDTDLIFCCLKSLSNNEKKSRFLAAVNDVMRRMHEWATSVPGADEKAVTGFEEDRRSFCASMEEVLPTISKLNDWRRVTELLKTEVPNGNSN